MAEPYSYTPLQSYNPNNVGYGQNIQSMLSGTYNYAPQIGYGQQAPQQGFNYGSPNNSGMYSPMDNTTSTMAKTGGGLPNLPYGSLAAGIFQLPFAIQAYHDAKKAVLPQYQANPYLSKSIAEADANRNQGFTNSEYAAYNQQLGQDKQNTYSNAIRLGGGNLGQSISAILQGQNVNARNQLAIGDAWLRRQNMQRADNLAFQQQNINDANTQLGVNNYNMKQQASAALINSTIGNLANPLNYIGGIV